MQRRGDAIDVSDRRAGFEIGLLLPGGAAEPTAREQREVGGVPEVGPIGDVALRDGGFEARGLADDPVGQQHRRPSRR